MGVWFIIPYHAAHLCSLCFAVCVLFLTTKSEVKILTEQHGEENNVAVDWRVRGDFSEEGICEPSLNNPKGQPCLEPRTTFHPEAMGTLHLMNTGLVAARKVARRSGRDRRKRGGKRLLLWKLWTSKWRWAWLWGWLRWSGAEEAKHPETELSLTHWRADETHLATVNTPLLSPSLLENVPKCPEVILGQRNQQMD